MAESSPHQSSSDNSIHPRAARSRRVTLALAGIGAALVAAAGVSASMPLHAAAVIHHSSNVAYVFDDSLFPCGSSGCGMNDGSGLGSSASIFNNAVNANGTAFSGSGNTGTYTPANGGGAMVNLTNVPTSTLNANANALSGFDTAIVYQTCAIGTQPTAMAAINQFLQNGGKVMIFDGDACSNIAKGTADWSSFVFPFTTNNPGPQGASGSYTHVVSSPLTTGLTTGAQSGDSMGDANVFTTRNASWFESISGNNINTNGIVQAYARTSSGGIAIYEGEDFWFTFGVDPHLQLVFDNELNLPWSPDSLPGSPTITLVPVFQAAVAGGTGQLTATVTNTSGVPQSGVTVTFSVTSGPDNGATNSSMTASNGTAPFSFPNSGGAGFDTIEASYVNGSNTLISNAALVDFVAPGAYTPLVPFRVYDTRSSTGPIGPGQQLTFTVTGVMGPTGESVPSSALAVVLNVTAINGTTGTYVTVFPTGAAQPNASNLNVPGGVIQANLAVVALGIGGQITIFNAAGSIDVAVDVQGYFAAPSAPPTPGLFHSIPPLRICDSRSGTGTSCSGHPLGAGTWAKVVVSGLPPGAPSGTPSVPANTTATGVALNLTAVFGTGGTFLSVQPPNSSDACPSGGPSSSNLNVPSGVALPNRVIVPLGPSQDVCVYNAVGTINFILDVNGWFGSGGESTAGLKFYAIPPDRICDTRSGTGTACSGSAIGPGGNLNVQVAGQGGLPASGPQAVIANVTAVLGTAGTFFTLYPAGTTLPLASDLNIAPGQIIPNLCIVQLGGSPPSLVIYSPAGTINAIVDISGWFQ